MCGILCYVILPPKNNPLIGQNNARNANITNYNAFLTSLNKLKHRGPDNTRVLSLEYNPVLDGNPNTDSKQVLLGFTRLAIMDTTPNGNQPFLYDNALLLCNGEIYNNVELGSDPTESNDCKCILPYYRKNGIMKLLDDINGEFSMVIFDGNVIYAARDRFGIRPLFVGYNSDYLVISSELKAIPTSVTNIRELKGGELDVIKLDYLSGDDIGNYITVKNFQKTTYDAYIRSGNSIYGVGMVINSNQIHIPGYFDKFKDPPFIFGLNDVKSSIENQVNKMSKYMESIRQTLTKAVKVRLEADRQVGFLLSGGLDSSLIVAIAAKLMPVDQIFCFSIGDEDSEDIKYAKMVTEYLGIKKHICVKFDTNKALSELYNVIKAVETCDTTTIRASTPQYMLANYIKNETDVRVLLSGEGSDEVHGSYRYFRDAPNVSSFHAERVNLLKRLYLFDNRRTDRTTAAHGLEVRVPYLDKEYVDLIMYSDPRLFMHTGNAKQKMEKRILRYAFSKNYLPDAVLWRSKEAFSDAVSSKSNNWIAAIKKFAENLIQPTCVYSKTMERNLTKEEIYYKTIFDNLYPNYNSNNMLYWMPKFQKNKVDDPSATVLASY